MKSKKTSSLVLFLSFLSTVTFCFGQYGGPNQVDLERSFNLDDSFSLQTVELDSLITWQERVILHVDRSVIKEDTPLFFKAYILTGPNRVRATLSKVLKIELTNKEKQIVASQYHKIEDGMSEGALAVPEKLDNGTYTLRAYTRWMQNYGEPFYYTKELQYGSTGTAEFEHKKSTNPFSVSFHPEGGNLIENFSNRLLIKIHSREREIGDMHGEIIDSKRNVVATVVPFGPHLMSAIFKPIPGESYMLKTNYGFSYPLPESLSNGYLLNVSNMNPSLLRIRVQATSGFTNSKVWISGEMGGITYFKKELKLQESSLEVDLQKQDIPFGVLTVSLIDAEGILWAKRPVIIHAKNDLRLEILPLVQDISKDEHAFKVKVTDSKGKPVATEVSLSATNFGNNSGLQEARNKTDFSWESYEISNGDSNNNALGFASQSRRKERFLNDIELITGVSSDNDMISQTVPNKIKYPFQQGLDLFGYAYNLNNKLLKNTKIQMLGASDADVIAQEFKTDSSGRIRLENLQLFGETELVFRTVGDEAASRLVKIIPVQKTFETKNISKSVVRVNSQKHGRVNKASKWEPIENEKRIELKEVEVTENKIERKRAMPAVYGLNAIRTRTVIQDLERPKRVFQLLQAIPGTMVTGDLDYPTVGRLIGGNSFGTRPVKPASTLDQTGPLWVLDGFILENSNNFKPEWGIAMLDIDRIELLVPAEASIYGSRASRGVFLVYTRNGSDYDYVNRKEGQLNFQGYFESPTFDSYVKQLNKRPKKYKNGITTLFWDPKIKTDENGEATVRFNTPSTYSRLKLKASAVTEQGEIGSVKVVF